MSLYDTFTKNPGPVTVPAPAQSPSPSKKGGGLYAQFAGSGGKPPVPEVSPEVHAAVDSVPKTFGQRFADSLGKQNGGMIDRIMKRGDYAPKPVPTESTISQDDGKGTLNSLESFLYSKTLKPGLSKNPVTGFVGDAFDTVKHSVTDLADRLDRFVYGLGEHVVTDTGAPLGSGGEATFDAQGKPVMKRNATARQSVGDLVSSVTGVGNVAISPGVALFKGAESIPVVGGIFKGANWAIGKTFGFVQDKVEQGLNLLPVSQETKDAVSKPIAELLTLAGAIYAGGKLEEHGPALRAKLDEHVPAVSENIAKIKTALRNDPVLGEAISKMMGPEVTKEALETAAQDAVAKPTVAREAEGVPVMITNQMRSDLAAKGFTPEAVSNMTPVQAHEALRPEAPAFNEPRMKPVGGGETKASKISEGIEARAVEKKIATEGFDSLSESERAVMKDQRAYADRMYEENPQQAKDIALGKEHAPEHMLSSVIFQKVVDMAEKAGDGALLHDLANSPHATELTAAGQLIRGAAEYRNPEGALENIKKVKSEREKLAEKSLKGKTVRQAKYETAKEIKSAVEKRAPKPKDWTEFLDSIEC